VISPSVISKPSPARLASHDLSAPEPEEPEAIELEEMGPEATEPEELETVAPEPEVPWTEAEAPNPEALECARLLATMALSLRDDWDKPATMTISLHDELEERVVVTSRLSSLTPPPPGLLNSEPEALQSEASVSDQEYIGARLPVRTGRSRFMRQENRR
jgi:hypothetical protein